MGVLLSTVNCDGHIRTSSPFCTGSRAVQPRSLALQPRTRGRSVGRIRQARMVTLVLGGVRSGKSRYAQLEAARFTRVTFVATARPSDPEMRRKIAAHRRERPAGWRTVEVSAALDVVIRREGRRAEVLLIDCLTTYCGALLSRSPSQSGRPGYIEALVEAIRATPASLLIVSNEVGSGVVPAFKSGRLFRDLLGEMNQAIARVADRVVLLVAGVPIAIKGSLS